jgi:hypothetical protein
LYIMRKLRGIRPFGRFRHPPKPWNPPETINKKILPPQKKPHHHFIKEMKR